MYFRILAGFLGGVIFFGGVLGGAEANSSGDYDPPTSAEIRRSQQANNEFQAASEQREQAKAKIEKEAEDFKKRIDGIKHKIDGNSDNPQVQAIETLDLGGGEVSGIKGEIDAAKEVLEALESNPQEPEVAAKIQKCLKGILLEAGEAGLEEIKKTECIYGTDQSSFIENNGISAISAYLKDDPDLTPILPRIEEFEKQAKEWQNLLEDLQVLEADLDNSEVLGEGVTEEPAQTTRTSLTNQIEGIKASILGEFANAGLEEGTDDEKIEELKEKINDYLEKVAIQRMRANSLKLMLEHDETIRALWNTVDNSRGFSVSGVLSVGNEADWELVSVDPESRTNILAYLIRLALQVIGTFAILMLVVGGYLMMTALNDDNRLQKGKTIVITTIAGLIIAFLSYLIVKVLFAFMF